MKKFTKIVTLVLAAVMLLACAAGCGGKKVSLKILDTAYANENYAIAVKKGNKEMLDKLNGALGALIADGTVKKVIDYYINGDSAATLPEYQKDAAGKPELHMATNAEFPPYEFHEGNKIMGIDAVIAGLIADKLGMKLVIDDMDFNATLVAVESGKSDFAMAGLTVRPDRLLTCDFTESYATGVQVVIVREDGKIKSLDDLSAPAEGKKWTIGVQNATTGDIYSSEEFEDTGLAVINRYSKGADAIAALVSGKIDCVIIDNEPAKAFVAANNGK